MKMSWKNLSLKKKKKFLFSEEKQTVHNCSKTINASSRKRWVLTRERSIFKSCCLILPWCNLAVKELGIVKCSNVCRECRDPVNLGNIYSWKLIILMYYMQELGTENYSMHEGIALEIIRNIRSTAYIPSTE